MEVIGLAGVDNLIAVFVLESNVIEIEHGIDLIVE
jgi:hypothetical protein